MTRAILRAHAKINLYLKILGRRPDGYHEIESVVQTVSLHDSLEFETADRFELEVDPPALPANRDNLVWKAAEALLEGRPARGARIVLRKRIPIGAGLGGGSSDAAAALVGLDRLWGQGGGEERLRKIAAGLGSDVPLFLVGGTVRVSGRGTEVDPLVDLPSAQLVLVHPGVPVSTREIYAQVQEPLTPRVKTGSIPAFGKDSPGSLEGWVRLGNDLESIAGRFCPAIREIKERLLLAGASAAAMTGSGSAVFGLFGTQDDASRAAKEMERLGWRAWSCVPIGRALYKSHLGLI